MVELADMADMVDMVDVVEVVETWKPCHRGSGNKRTERRQRADACPSHLSESSRRRLNFQTPLEEDFSAHERTQLIQDRRITCRHSYESHLSMDLDESISTLVRHTQFLFFFYFLALSTSVCRTRW